MKVEYDSDKNRWNIKERKLSFEQVIDLEWDTAQIIEDSRKNYPEQRFVSMAFLDERLHVVCFTPIEGGIRVISFRKANSREVKKYEQATIDRWQWRGSRIKIKGFQKNASGLRDLAEGIIICIATERKTAKEEPKETTHHQT